MHNNFHSVNGTHFTILLNFQSNKLKFIQKRARKRFRPIDRRIGGVCAHYYNLLLLLLLRAIISPICHFVNTYLLVCMIGSFFKKMKKFGAILHVVAIPHPPNRMKYVCMSANKNVKNKRLYYHR